MRWNQERMSPSIDIHRLPRRSYVSKDVSTGYFTKNFPVSILVGQSTMARQPSMRKLSLKSPDSASVPAKNYTAFKFRP